MAVDKEKRNKRQYQWQKENVERMNVLFPIGTKEQIQKSAYNKKMSASEYIRNAITRQITEDEEGESISDKVITNSIEWLRSHGHKEKEITDFIKHLTSSK